LGALLLNILDEKHHNTGSKGDALGEPCDGIADNLVEGTGKTLQEVAACEGDSAGVGSPGEEQGRPAAGGRTPGKGRAPRAPRAPRSSSAAGGLVEGGAVACTACGGSCTLDEGGHRCGHGEGRGAFFDVGELCGTFRLV